MSAVVSEEVWQQLDPGAGRLSTRSTVRAFIAVALALGLTLTAAAAWQSGAIVPHLSWGLYGIQPTAPPSDTVGIDIVISNDGLAGVTVLGVGRGEPGLDLVGTQARFPVYLASNAELRVIVTYRITDCGQVPPGSAPVTVAVQRSWGIQLAQPRDFLSEEFDWHQAVLRSWCR